MRSAGKKVRKEDDINLLDIDEMYDYITSRYEADSSLPEFILGGTFISIPILMYGCSCYRLSIRFEGGKIKSLILQVNIDICTDILHTLKERFDINYDNFKGIFVTGKNGEVTNSLCIDLIETIIKNTHNEVLRRK